jgi:hypothetical protein
MKGRAFKSLPLSLASFLYQRMVRNTVKMQSRQPQQKLLGDKPTSCRLCYTAVVQCAIVILVNNNGLTLTTISIMLSVLALVCSLLTGYGPQACLYFAHQIINSCQLLSFKSTSTSLVFPFHQKNI